MGVQACAHTAGMREEKRRSLGVHSECHLSDTGKEKETSPPRPVGWLGTTGG